MLAKFSFGSTDTIRRIVPDVRAARALEAALGRLPPPWRALRNRRAAAQDGPPWVRCLAFHPERGIAVIDLLPTNPQFAVEPLADFLKQSGLAEEIGGLPEIAPVPLGEPPSGAVLTRALDSAFRAPPRDEPLAKGWADKVATRLMQTPGLLLAEIPRALDQMALAAVAPVPDLGSQDFGPPPPPPSRPRPAAIEAPEPGSRTGQILAREQAGQGWRRLALGAGGALLLTAIVASAMTVPGLKFLSPAPHSTPAADAVPVIPPPSMPKPDVPQPVATEPVAPTPVSVAPAPQPAAAVMPSEPSLPDQAAAAPPAAPPVQQAIPAPPTIPVEKLAKPAHHVSAPPAENLPLGMMPHAPSVTIQSEPELSSPSLSRAVPIQPPPGLPPVPAGAVALSGPPPVAAPRVVPVATPPPPMARPVPMRRYYARRSPERVHVEIHVPRWLSTMFSSR